MMKLEPHHEFRKGAEQNRNLSQMPPMKPQPIDTDTAFINASDHSEADNEGLKLWKENPRLAFERLRDLVCKALQITSLLYQDALNASPEESLASLGSDVLEPLHQAIFDAQEIWYETPICRYLERREGPVYLSRLGQGAVTGSCYHDLALAVAVRVLEGAQGSELARDFVRNLRYHTAAGDRVALHLASLIPRVRCECQLGVSQWQAEIQPRFPQGREPGKIHATVGSNQRKKKKVTSAEERIDSKLSPALSNRQYDLLEALYRMNAFHADAKQTTLDVAQKAEGPEVNPEAFKEPIAELKRLKYVDTKEGRGGGCWLTSSGRRLIKKIRKL
jgi:hypothetical protein